jgi:transposase
MGPSRWAVNKHHKTEHPCKKGVAMHLVGSVKRDPLWVAPTRSDRDCRALSTTINLCKKSVNDALEEKKPFTGSGRRKVILLQNNARLHTAKNTLETISDLGWEILCHAAYSPDLAPSDYYLFQALQHHLTDSRFKSVEDVEKSLDKFINSKLPSFFRSGIRQLPERWKKCIDSEGDYFQYWVCIYVFINKCQSWSKKAEN